MADRNWDQELAKIDKQMASVSDEQLLAQTRTERGAVSVPAGAKAPAAAAAAKAPAVGASPGKGSWVAWAQLIVATAAATGLWFWPWPTRCGLNAVTFTAATGAVTLLGLWSAVGSWRHRQSKAHILSFAIIVWGLVLGAREVLPRIGYAIATPERPAGWTCDALPLPTPAPTPDPGTTPPSDPANAPGTTPSGAPPGATSPSKPTAN